MTTAEGAEKEAEVFIRLFVAPTLNRDLVVHLLRTKSIGNVLS